MELHKLNKGQPIETELNSEVYLEEALKFQRVKFLLRDIKLTQGLWSALKWIQESALPMRTSVNCQGAMAEQAVVAA